MKEKIVELCKRIEKDNNVKILFAIESGSRLWRMHSKDSDYDVRFVFKRPLEDYIRIDSRGDVINSAYDISGEPCDVKGSMFDFSGFDIFKFLVMIKKSNPSCIEWLNSDIVYYGEVMIDVKDYIIKNFNPLALYEHYKSMAKQNYFKYLKSHSHVTYKKYLYTFRGIVNAKWVMNSGTVPPIIFPDALKDDVIPEGIVIKLKEIIELKSKGKEKSTVDNVKVLDNYIEDFFKEEERPKAKLIKDTKFLNEILQREILG